MEYHIWFSNPLPDYIARIIRRVEFRYHIQYQDFSLAHKTDVVSVMQPLEYQDTREPISEWHLEFMAKQIAREGRLSTERQQMAWGESCSTCSENQNDILSS